MSRNVNLRQLCIICQRPTMWNINIACNLCENVRQVGENVERNNEREMENELEKSEIEEH